MVHCHFCACDSQWVHRIRGRPDRCSQKEQNSSWLHRIVCPSKSVLEEEWLHRIVCPSKSVLVMSLSLSVDELARSSDFNEMVCPSTSVPLTYYTVLVCLSLGRCHPWFKKFWPPPPRQIEKQQIVIIKFDFIAFVEPNDLHLTP